MLSLASKYYWEKTMYKDIGEFIDSCQRSKPKLNKTGGCLYPVAVRSNWYS